MKSFYRVQKGDSLSCVCNRLEIPVSIMIETNNIKDEIEEGDLLIVEKVDNIPTYIVKPFEDEFSLGQKFSISPNELLEKNKTPYLYFGQRIIIK